MTPDFDLSIDCYRRRIDVAILDPTTTRCSLQDDFHHFVVLVHHDGTAVVDTEVDSVRFPWMTCPGADAALRSLIGMPLAERFTAASRYAVASHNCTHQFDAAAHAVTHTAATHLRRRTADRRYDVEIGANIATASAGQGRNRLWVDGHADLDWMVEPGRVLHNPRPPFDAAPWKGGFMRWADEHLDPDAAERAIVLRRACDIGMGRGMDLDAIPNAGNLLAGMSGVCFTMQPDVAEGSRRNAGAIRDFAHDPNALNATG